MRGYALRRTVRDVVPDVVSETFLIAWRRLDDVPDDALPWLYGVARRVLANQRRSAGRRAALEDRLAATSSVGDVRDPAESIHDAELVRRALARLPEPYREALMLVAWHGLSGARAARAAGCSRTAFGVRLHRARGALKREISALEPRAAAGEARSLEVS